MVKDCFVIEVCRCSGEGSGVFLLVDGWNGCEGGGGGGGRSGVVRGDVSLRVRVLYRVRRLRHSGVIHQSRSDH